MLQFFGAKRPMQIILSSVETHEALDLNMELAFH